MPIIPETARRTELIEAWIQDLIERDKADSTLGTYADVVCRAHAELPHGVPFATSDELRAWIWVPGRKPASRKLYRSAFSSFFSWACHPADPRLDFNPMPLIPSVKAPRGRPRPITVDALADILDRARMPYQLWYRLAAGAGLRCVEISRLDREDITQEQIWVLGKGGIEGFVPTHPAIWATAQRLPAGPVARMRTGERADRHSISNRGGRVLAQLGYPAVTMHRLRHYFGSQLRRAAGGDLRIAQEGLRHAGPTQTAVYTDWLNSDLIAAVRAVPLAV